MKATSASEPGCGACKSKLYGVRSVAKLALTRSANNAAKYVLQSRCEGRNDSQTATISLEVASVCFVKHVSGRMDHLVDPEEEGPLPRGGAPQVGEPTIQGVEEPPVGRR